MAKFYYNGVLLPEIPADVLAEYPYCWIRNDLDHGRYILLFGKRPWYFYSGMRCVDSSDLPYYYIQISTATEATEWPYSGNAKGTYMAISETSTVLWSRYNIPNGSSTATDIYFYGTNPVPENADSGGNEKNYTELTYIESTGTQYVDTGILARSGLRILLTAELTSTDGDMAFFGARDDFATNRLCWYHHQNGDMYYYYGSSGYPYVKRSDFAQKHHYSFDNNNVYIDGSKISFSNSISASQFSSQFPMAVFACINEGVATQHAKMRLYTMRVYYGYTLIADFIPVLDENNVTCLYDKVTKSYYYNQGTGMFIAGEAVQYVPIKNKTLTSFADLIRSLGGVSSELSTAEMLDILTSGRTPT